MALLKIAEWEDNKYDDSDFYAAYFDPATGLIEREEIGSTRYAGKIQSATPHTTNWTLETVDLFREAFQRYIYATLRYAENKDVLKPQNVEKGDVVKTLEILKPRKIFRLESCKKCNGTGKWINPNSPLDARVCFTCNGSSKTYNKTGETAPKGFKIETGIIGTVLSCEAHGTFYSNGYNQPGRSNRQTKIEIFHPTESTIVVNAALEKLRLARDPLSNQEITDKAIGYSFQWQYTSFVGCKAWLSKDYIPQALKEALKANFYASMA